MARRVRGAILLGIVAAAVLAWGTGLVHWQGLFAAPPSLAPTAFQLDLRAALDPRMIHVVALFLFMAVFDAIGTLIGIGEQAGFLRDGKLPRATRALMADSSGTVLRVAPRDVDRDRLHRERHRGRGRGADRSRERRDRRRCSSSRCSPGRWSGWWGAGFPWKGARVLQPITAPALIVVGSLMARNLVNVDWPDITESFPAFLVLAGIPFTWSIADGIAFGFIAYPVLKLLAGRPREASWLVYALGLLFVLRYALIR